MNIRRPVTQSGQRHLFVLTAAALVASGFTAADVSAQTDSITRKSGSTVRGKIVSTTPSAVAVETSGGNQEIGVEDIRQVRLDDEPTWLSGAKARYREDRYAACHEAIESNQLESPRDLLRQEAEFYRAMAAGMVALGSGDITLNQAGTLLRKFTTDHPDSFHFYEATELFGDLAMNSGSFSTASDSYQKLVDSGVPEIAAAAKLKMGKALLLSGDYQQAASVFTEVQQQESADPQTRLIARCFAAQAISQQGQAAEAIEILSEMIRTESADQEELFARIYNALGTAHLANKDYKAARLAFMHTQLMFYRNREAYAEALYHLHQIAKALQDSERATRTRQLLKSRFPNSHWASKI